MANPQKISQLSSAGPLGDNHLFVGVDPANTSMSSTGTDLKVTAAQFLDYIERSLGPLLVTAVKTVDYAPAIGEFVPVDATAGNVTITLPVASDRDSVGVILVATASAHTCSIVASGSDVFLVAGGSTTTTFNSAGKVVVWMYSSGIWYPTNN